MRRFFAQKPVNLSNLTDSYHEFRAGRGSIPIFSFF